MVLDRPRTDEQLGADLRVGEALAGQLGDLRLLGGEDVARVQGALARGLAGGRELATGTLGEPVGSDAAERVVGGPELLAPPGARRRGARAVSSERGRGVTWRLA